MIGDTASLHAESIRLFKKTIEPDRSVKQTKLCMEV
jgi:hypothetical protein